MNDFALYFFILFPIAFSFSNDIVHDRMKPEQYPSMISDAFNSGSLKINDPVTFSFAVTLFEQIMIHRITYEQMLKLFENYKGDKKDILLNIGYVLLSSFSTATEAAKLHLGVLSNSNDILKKITGLYKFFIVPYFEKFWKRKVETNSTEFTGKDRLLSKGYYLIEKAGWDKKIQTIFRIYSDHMNLNLSSEWQQFIDGAGL